MTAPDTLSFAPEQVIFNEGDKSDGIYLIQEGEIEVYRIRENIPIVLGKLVAGEVLGTLTIFSNETRKASARALKQTTLVFYQNSGMSESFKNLPGWCQAVIKDALRRLNHVNNLLTETKIHEKNLLRSIGTSHHHSAQLAFLLSSFVKKNSLKNDVNVSIFQTSDFLIYAEKILNKDFNYLEKMYKAFIECGLVKEVNDKKFGTILVNPNDAMIHDFAVFSIEVVKKGLNFFTPKKFHPWMSALTRISRKNNNLEKFKRADLALLLQTEVGRQDGESLLTQMLDYKIITEQNGEINFSTLKLHKSVIFESLVRIIKDIKPS
jgi:hypothetical protein